MSLHRWMLIQVVLQGLLSRMMFQLSVSKSRLLHYTNLVGELLFSTRIPLYSFVVQG
uniref:Uncharacterized protein n=1 Tax=Arundo donax TaxID=35708 RepID=A0A0A9E7V6_ARUDO